MKLEVGKKYVVRAAADVKWIRVDAIRPEAELGCNQVAATGCDANNKLYQCCYSTEGKYLDVDGIDHYDIVAEYKEPELCLGPKHVGRRVRLRDGSISLICEFIVDSSVCPSPAIHVKTAYNNYYINGQCFLTRAKDIVEILP